MFDSHERAILDSLDVAICALEAREKIDLIVHRVAKDLAAKKHATMAWEPIPLEIYGGHLPRDIRSSWVFILRAGATTGAERHPNSHQRMMSYCGEGDMQTGGEGHWQSHRLSSDPRAALEGRWVSIPTNVWHQAVVPASDWVVVSFHTVAAVELIEERPAAADSNLTTQRLYLDGHETQHSPS